MFGLLRGLLISRQTLSRNLVHNMLMMSGIMSSALPATLFNFMVETVLSQPGAGYFAFRTRALHTADDVVASFLAWLEGDDHIRMSVAAGTIPHPCDERLALVFSRYLSDSEREDLQASRMAIMKQKFMAHMQR